MPVEKPLSGKVAVVTGSTSGIGEGCARALAAAGANVVINDHIRHDSDFDLAKEMQKATRSKVHYIRADMSKAKECAALIEKATKKFGKVDILVNNAGITRDTLLLRMKPEDWQAVIDLNLTGVFLCTRAVSKLMLKQRSGRIINIASVAGLMGNPGQANYSAAKAGVIGFTKTIAKEMSSRSVTVNAVAPGFIKTDMTEDPANTEEILKYIPLGRYGEATEVAGLIRFLAADPAAAYITGQVLTIDGGMVM